MSVSDVFSSHGPSKVDELLDQFSTMVDNKGNVVFVSAETADFIEQLREAGLIVQAKKLDFAMRQNLLASAANVSMDAAPVNEI